MMMSRINCAVRAATVIAVGVLGGCSLFTDPASVRVVTTAALVTVDGYAKFVVHNDTPETIFLDRCGDRVQAGMDRRVGGGWQNEMAAVCVLSYYAGPLLLAAGESVTDSVLVRSAGTFRVYVGYGRGEQRILRLARSGSFTVE